MLEQMVCGINLLTHSNWAIEVDCFARYLDNELPRPVSTCHFDSIYASRPGYLLIGKSAYFNCAIQHPHPLNPMP